MTIEQLRREVAREVSAAIAVGEAKGAPAISYALESRRVRAAFDAYDKAVIATALEARDATIGYRDCQITALKQLVSERDARIAKLEGVATTLHGALARYTCEGCPICPGDCSSANPPVVDCPTQRAIDAYRQYDQAILTKQEPKS